MLKEVDGELWLVAVSPSPPRPSLAPPPQHDEGTGGLELGLHPVLRVGVVIGNVDPQTSVFTEDDEGRAMVGRLSMVRVCVCVCVCVCARMCV